MTIELPICCFCSLLIGVVFMHTLFAKDQVLSLVYWTNCFWFHEILSFLRFLDYWMNSVILAHNSFYQGHLHKFLTPVVGSNPQWVLCYRASTHGWAASTFHNRCDGKRNTVSIIKNGQYVFGGYTDIPWGK